MIAMAGAVACGNQPSPSGSASLAGLAEVISIPFCVAFSSLPGMKHRLRILQQGFKPLRED